jgi:SPOR domain
MSYRVDLEPEDLRSVRRQGPGIRTAVGLLVVALAVAGSWAGWRTLHTPAPGGAIPMIHADTRPLKVPPTDPGGLRVPDQNINVLNGINAPEPKVEQLLPPPETPLPRPAPSEPAVTDLPAAPAVASVAAPPPAGPVAAAMPEATLAAPAVATAVAPAPPTAAPAVAPPPAAAPVARPASAPASVPATVGGWRLQLGSMRTPEAVAPEWSRLKRAQPDLLGKLAMTSVRTDLGGRGVFYRIEAGPLADEAAAQRICTELKARKVGCILVRP